MDLIVPNWRISSKILTLPETVDENAQTPPDLVVNLKPLIFLSLFCHLSGDKPLSKYRVDTVKQGVKHSQHLQTIGLPLNPGECEKSFYVAAVVKPLLHIFSVHSLGGMSHYPERSGGFLWRPDLASPMPSTRAGSDTVTTG